MPVYKVRVEVSCLERVQQPAMYEVVEADSEDEACLIAEGIVRKKMESDGWEGVNAKVDEEPEVIGGDLDSKPNDNGVSL